MAGKWQSIALDHALDINPTVRLRMGEIYPFVDMQALGIRQKFVSPQQEREFKGNGSRFMEGDTLMARITPCLENGKISRYKSNGDIKEAHGSTEFIVLRHKEGITDQEFVYYLTISDQVLPRAISQMTGSSGRQRVPTDSLKRIIVSLPPIDEQCAIAAVLKTLDAKIELNQQMFETQEGIARALFKSWFVDYDPVHARKGKQKSEGLVSELASLFPNGFKDGYPLGWSKTSVYSCAEYINGAAYKNMHFTNDESALPVIKIAELKNGIGQGTQFTNSELGEKYRIDTGDILFSWSGSPETSIDTFLWVGGPAWLNQHIFKVTTDAAEKRTFVFFLLKHLKSTFIAIAKDKQTTGLGHVTVQDLKRLQIVYPSQEVLGAFSEVATPILNEMQRVLEQIRLLANLRDTLLPKLISGQLRIQDIAGDLK